MFCQGRGGDPETSVIFFGQFGGTWPRLETGLHAPFRLSVCLRKKNNDAAMEPRTVARAALPIGSIKQLHWGRRKASSYFLDGARRPAGGFFQRSGISGKFVVAATHDGMVASGNVPPSSWLTGHDYIRSRSQHGDGGRGCARHRAAVVRRVPMQNAFRPLAFGNVAPTLETPMGYRRRLDRRRRDGQIRLARPVPCLRKVRSVRRFPASIFSIDGDFPGRSPGIRRRIELPTSHRRLANDLFRLPLYNW